VSEANIHQLLHGYRGGHGQWHASTKLVDDDAELTTRLSDLSGSLSSGLQFQSYLTVYPLPSQRFFALAKTWPDPQAPRAGCVVTHTLLIPTDIWSTLTDVRSLALLFENPRLGNNHDFTKPIRLQTNSRHVAADFNIDRSTANNFILRYFGQGIRPVVWFNVDDATEYMWRLLEHLWPKLRSTFSCCTFSLQPRTLQDGPFDLLFAPPSVYSRFTKLASQHLIESGKPRKGPQPTEPWCEYWAETLFSAELGPPSREGQLSIWNELGEDPTAIRKLSLIQELRLRADQSPTAAVGAIDVVESLARDPQDATALKQSILSDAIGAAEAARKPVEGLTSLRLIEDRLGREAFRNVGPIIKNQLTAAVAAATINNPDAAFEAGQSWLSDTASQPRSCFVNGVLAGLQRVAQTDPGKLTKLNLYPNVAIELLSVEPSFVGPYLRIGGALAAGTVAGWLSSLQDDDVLRVARKSALSGMDRSQAKEILPAALSHLPSDDVRPTLELLSERSNSFDDEDIESFVSAYISHAQPNIVREWASGLSYWSKGLAEIVAATYPSTRQGLDEALSECVLSFVAQADVVAILTRQAIHTRAYWFRDIAEQDTRLIGILLRAASQSASAMSATAGLLSEVREIPIAQSEDCLALVPTFEGLAVFSSLHDFSMRSVLYSYLSGGMDYSRADAFLASRQAFSWFASVQTSRLADVLNRASYTSTEAVSRSWSWLANAPSDLYRRRSMLLELCEPLLRHTRLPLPMNFQDSLVAVLRRSKTEADFTGRQALATKMLRFAFDNTHILLGNVVAEAFSDVYAVAVEKDETSRPSIFSRLFGSYSWDHGKDLRVSLIDAFWRSDWRPGDLAIAASSANILRKVFKRMHRRQGGDEYIQRIILDLARRNEDYAIQVATQLRALASDRHFYEEWD
jgi:hypothetical protein